MLGFLKLGAGFELVRVSQCIVLFPSALLHCKYLCCGFFSTVFLRRSSKAELIFRAFHPVVKFCLALSFTLYSMLFLLHLFECPFRSFRLWMSLIAGCKPFTVLFLHPLVVKSYPDIPDYWSFSFCQWKCVVGLSPNFEPLEMLRSPERGLLYIFSQVFKHSVVIVHGQQYWNKWNGVYVEALSLRILVLCDCFMITQSSGWLYSPVAPQLPCQSAGLMDFLWW